MSIFNRKRILSIVLVFIMVISLGTVNIFAAEETVVTPDISIIHTNDMHGNLLSTKNNIGSDIVASIKNATKNSILVDAGDATQGNSLATLTQGQDIIDIMNMAEYDVMVTGNHEFDYGYDQLLENAERANFPILSANAMKENKAILDGVSYNKGTQINNGSNYIVEMNSYKVGFFGIITPDTATSTNPKGITGITFNDAIKTSKAQIELLQKQDVDVIVGIMHIGVDPSSSVTSEKIAAKLANSGLNIIIDGHSHTVYNNTVDDILIAQTGSASSNVGRIDITIAEDGKVNATSSTIKAETALANFKPVKEITKFVKNIVKEQEKLLSQIIGNTATTLWGGTINGTNEARLGETNLGNLVADSMVGAAHELIMGTKYEGLPVVALENGGGVRSTINRGDITVGDVINVLPFGNSLAFKEVTPAILYEALENGVKGFTTQDSTTGLLTGASGAFPQVSGMSFEFDPTQEVGKRVIAIYLNDSEEALERKDKNTKIVLASNDFEIAGGDGYSMLIGLPSVGEGGVLDVVLQNYIIALTEASNGSFAYPIYSNRIILKSSYEPTTYNAQILVNDKDGKPIANTEIWYSVNYSDIVTATSDVNGIITINDLADGPNDIIVEDTASVLINNYSGAGVSIPVVVSIDHELIDTVIPEMDIVLSESGMIDALLEQIIAELSATPEFVDFDFDSPITRAEFISLLATLNGIDSENVDIEVKKIFSDIDDTSDYAVFVKWARDNGIIVGDGGKFNPDLFLTREDAVVILNRYITYYFGSELAGAELTYSDADSISDYAVDSVKALQTIISPNADNKFNPQNGITYRECTKMILSFIVEIMKF